MPDNATLAFTSGHEPAFSDWSAGLPLLGSAWSSGLGLFGHREGCGQENRGAFSGCGRGTQCNWFVLHSLAIETCSLDGTQTWHGEKEQWIQRCINLRHCTTNNLILSPILFATHLASECLLLTSFRPCQFFIDVHAAVYCDGRSQKLPSEHPWHLDAGKRKLRGPPVLCTLSR